MGYSEALSEINNCRDRYLEFNKDWAVGARHFSENHFASTESREMPDDFLVRDHPGWLCAQRRFAQGLLKAAMYHLPSTSPKDGNDDKNENATTYFDARVSVLEKLPDYLIMVDDDTYFNPQMFLELYGDTNPNDPKMYSGCLFETNPAKSITWEFPYGGFGTIVSKGALERLVRPIYCDGEEAELERKILHTNGTISTIMKLTTSLTYNGDDEYRWFQENACTLLTDDEIGLKKYYKTGTSLGELFSLYSSQVESMCLHGDWIMGYLAKFLVEYRPPEKSDTSKAERFFPLNTWPTQCGNHSLAPRCDPQEHMFCHNQNELAQLRNMYTVREKLPQQYKRGDAEELTTVLHDTVINWRDGEEQVLASRSTPTLTRKIKPTGDILQFQQLALPTHDTTLPHHIEWVEQLRDDTVLHQHSVGTPSVSPESAWLNANKWYTQDTRSLLPPRFENDDLAVVMDKLRTGKIVKASAGEGGSQLKLLLEFEGGQRAIFKPARYGFWDQHSAEVAAFHLSRMLNMTRAPIVVGRRINVMRELINVADPDFLDTFVVDDPSNPSTYCFRGLCEYCSTSEPVCPSNMGEVEGAVIMMLPTTNILVASENLDNVTEGTSQVLESSTGTSGEWKTFSMSWRKAFHFRREKHAKLSKQVFTHVSRHLDIVETSILDFLILNYDRWQFEYIDNGEDGDGAILMLDQGKGFVPGGARDQDYFKPLRPLMYKCMVRKSTYTHLRWIEKKWGIPGRPEGSGGNITSPMLNPLSSALRRLTSVDIARPPHVRSHNVLRDEDYDGLDQRFRIVMDEIRECINKKGRRKVLLADDAIKW
uniref:FAM20 C-terminal domain-containing protein n=1 Tax=Pseudictyota dubia TaxID=2749911 RepID=A0A7R9VVZ0_9STRA